MSHPDAGLPEGPRREYGGGVTSRWTSAHVEAIALRPIPAAPRIDPAALGSPLPGFDLWDHWPVQEADGRTATIAGGELIMALSAPIGTDPEERHGRARIRLLFKVGDAWNDLGPAMPDGLSPGSREWAGSAVIAPDREHVTLYFTAAGHRGEAMPSFDQRLFEARARLNIDAGVPRLSDWTVPVESVASDGHLYARDMSGGGAIGTIKAFRDPAYFRDPADGGEYLLFAGSSGTSASAWNGVVGAARRERGVWRLLPPLISGDGVNNELERPHLLHRDGSYYLFWSTQAKVFAAPGPRGPTGLYGMVADAVAGPYRPLNGTGLVFANPPSAPAQAYSWLVLPDLRVSSFADVLGLNRAPADAVEARAHFGGVPAPELRIAIDGIYAGLA